MPTIPNKMWKDKGQQIATKCLNVGYNQGT